MSKEDSILVKDAFGGCPHCGKQDGLFNVGRAHWFVCHEHRVRWHVGHNLFSGWKDQTEVEQREKWSHIEDYEDVKDGILLVGVWSRDPETRRRELETYNYETAVVEVKAEIARRRREVLMEAMEVLERLVPEMDRGETIVVTVDERVRVEFCAPELQDIQDIPF
jgi:hypothetical protein